jgi:hypothetical protein
VVAWWLFLLFSFFLRTDLSLDRSFSLYIFPLSSTAIAKTVVLGASTRPKPRRQGKVTSNSDVRREARKSRCSCSMERPFHSYYCNCAKLHRFSSSAKLSLPSSPSDVRFQVVVFPLPLLDRRLLFVLTVVLQLLPHIGQRRRRRYEELEEGSGDGVDVEIDRNEFVAAVELARKFKTLRGNVCQERKEEGAGEGGERDKMKENQRSLEKKSGRE